MPRRVEDIIRTDKRSIRSTPNKETKRASTREKSSTTASDAEEEVPIHRIKAAPKVVEVPEETPKKKPAKIAAAKSSSKSEVRGLSKKIWIFAAIGVVVIVVAAAYVASVGFSRAKFTVVPITIPLNVANTTIVATATSSAGYLRYEVAPFTGSASSSIMATDGPYISTKASGAITIYNYYSKSPVRLIAGTRFSNNLGQIYRLTTSIVIPAATNTNGATTSGSLVAAIMADQPGAEYGMVKTSQNELMRIVSYLGGPRYDTVYGKLKTDVSGGFVGTKKTVSPAGLASTTKQIQALLTDSLRSLAKNSVRDGYITYDNAYTMTFSAPVVGGGTSNQARVSVTGTLYQVIFKKTDLIAKLAGPQKLLPLGNSPYNTSGLESLSFTITNPNTFSAAKGNALIARLNGDVVITGIVPVDEIRSKLAGLSLTDTKNVLMSYSTVIDVPKSSGELFPSWASKVPKDQSRISIVLEE